MERAINSGEEKRKENREDRAHQKKKQAVKGLLMDIHKGQRWPPLSWRFEQTVLYLSFNS
jgi:hypothetical protein